MFSLDEFMLARRQRMNEEMERKGLELPDPDDLVMPGDMDLSDEYKRALYYEHWATLAANASVYSAPAWTQLELPGMPTLLLTAARGWCAPEETVLT